MFDDSNGSTFKFRFTLASHISSLDNFLYSQIAFSEMIFGVLYFCNSSILILLIRYIIHMSFTSMENTSALLRRPDTYPADHIG